MSDESKLPKWAQDRIFILRQELAAARRALDAQTKTRVYQRNVRGANRDHDVYRYLDETLSVSFQYGADQFSRLDAHMMADGSLKLYATDGQLVINPEASNVVRLRSTRF